MEQGSRERQGTRGYHGSSKGKKGCLIQLEKEDSNKQFIWFKILEMEISSELQHVIFSRKFQKLTKAEGLTTKTPLQP